MTRLPLPMCALLVVTAILRGAEVPASGPYLGQTPPGSRPALFAPGVISTGLAERDVAVSVDGREDSVPPKKSNYYVFFRRDDGAWTSGVNAGSAMNDPANTVVSPYVSPDGRYLFFASNAPREASRTSLRGLTLPRLAEMSAMPQNGNSDIYWVSASLLDAMRISAGLTKPPSRAGNGG